MDTVLQAIHRSRQDWARAAGRSTACLMVGLVVAAGAGAQTSTDPLLESLVEEALQRNPAIQAAQDELAAARLRPAQARTLPDPTLTIGYQNDGIGFSLGSEIMTQVIFMWTQPLPYPGKLKLAGRVLEKDAERAVTWLERVRLSLQAEVERAYARLVLARDVLALIDEQEMTLQQIEGVARARYSVGQGAQQDVLRVQIEITRIEQLRSQQRAEIQIRLAELNRLLNRPAQQALETSVSLVPQNYLPPLETFLEQAYSKSPELREAELVRERAKLQADLARKNLRPDFSLSGGYMNRGDLPLMWQASFGITLPLYKSTKQEPALREAETLERAAAAARESIQLQLRFRSQERLAQLEATGQIAQLFQSGILPQDQLSVDAALANYQTGQIPFIAVLEAVNVLYLDRADHLSQLAALRTTRSTLEELSLEPGPTTATAAADPGAMSSPARTSGGGMAPGM